MLGTVDARPVNHGKHSALGGAISHTAPNPASPAPLSYYPALQQQIDNFRNPSRWDEHSTALLKVVAGKLHADGEIDDHLLAAVADFDGATARDGVPESLRELFRRVAAELERDPDTYHALLLRAPAAAPALAQDGNAVASRVLSDMAWNVLNKVVQQLLIESLPIQGLGRLRENYEELRQVYAGNFTPQGRLQHLADALDRLSRDLAALGGQNTAMRPALLKLQAYLDAVGPWLHSVSTQWQTLEHGIHEFQDNASTLGKVVSLLATTDTLLADPTLQAIVGKDTLDGIGQGLGALRQTLGQVQLLQALPGDADLSAYLNIVAANPLLRQALDESLLKLAQALASVRKDYPGEGSLAEKLSWLAGALADPAVREQLQPHLEMWLVDEPRANQIFALLQFAGQLRHFPTDGSLGSQALWLLAQASGHAPASAWTQAFQNALGAQPATLELLNRLLAAHQGTASWGGLMRDLAKELAPSALWLAGRGAANALLPSEAVRELEKFYQDSAAGESWADWGKRLAGSAATIAKPYVVGALMGDPLAAATVRYGEAIQKHTSFDETLRWFVANDPSDNKALQFAYGQYLNAMLLWQAYQAFNSSNAEETEAALRQLSRQLKDYQVVKHYPQLEPLIDLLPLLPALREARSVVGAQPAADTWLGWAQQWLGALSGSQSRSLLELREQLSRKVENWLADAAMSACSSMAERPWGLLPGAAAAPTTAADNAPTTEAGTLPASTEAASIAPTASGGGARWELGVGGGLTAVGVGLIAYGLWQARQAGRAAPPPQDIEMVPMGASREPDDQTESTAHSGLIAPPAAPTPVATPSLGGRLWEQKLPLLLGLAATATGAGVLGHYWMSRGADAATPTDDNKEYQRVWALLQEHPVPDLDFLFYDELAGEVGEESAISAEVAESVPVAEGGRHRRSAADINSGNIHTHIEALLQKTGLKNDPAVRALCKYVDHYIDVIFGKRGNPNHPVKNLMRLERMLEEEPVLDAATRQRLRPLMDGLWHIANSLSDTRGQESIRRFKAIFLLRSPSHVRDGVSTITTALPMTTPSPLSPEVRVRRAVESLQRMGTINAPILDPATFIDDYIRRELQTYEARTGKRLSLSPETPISVTVTTQEPNTGSDRAQGGGEVHSCRFRTQAISAAGRHHRAVPLRPRPGRQGQHHQTGHIRQRRS